MVIVLANTTYELKIETYNILYKVVFFLSRNTHFSKTIYVFEHISTF